jgi:23S rRNA (adenine-N6)-dimethyltransferase
VIPFERMILSQNFIKSPTLVKELLSVSSLNSSDLVVEIGPGRGIITQTLISYVSKVISVEKDRQLYTLLKDKFSNTANLQIIYKNFLEWDLPKSPYKIFSNIPFSITADIINKILKSLKKPNEMYLIMQLEAANKYLLSNNVNNQDAILLSPFYDVQILGDIDRSAFTPKPQVNIVFAKFTLKKKPLIKTENYQQFKDFVIYGFNQWKPNIFEIYKKIFSYDQFKKINHQLKINDLKPSQLNIDQWISLFEIFSKFVSIEKQRLVFSFKKVYLNNTKVNNL